MAERRRAILVALRSNNSAGRPSSEGHSLAHQIGLAGDHIPALSPAEPEQWSPFGERRIVRDMPTFLECEESPFTAHGRRYVARLEQRLSDLDKGLDEDESVKAVMDRHDESVSYFKRRMEHYPARIKELEELVEELSSQLTRSNS